MVLRTELRTPSGRVVLSDFMPLHADDKHNDIGRHSPAAIGRVVEGIQGSVELDVEIAVRPEYGLTTPLVSEDASGLWHTRGGPIRATIATDVELEPDRGVLRAAVPGAGGRAPLLRAQRHRPMARGATDAVVGGRDRGAHDDTIDGWQSWATKLVGYEGDHRDLLRRSAVVLQALNYAPTGAIVAAPTTSLPEAIGGVRNWDYRYTWVRDASFTIGALCGRRLPRSRPARSSTSSPRRRRQPRDAARTCRSCTASAASTT